MKILERDEEFYYPHDEEHNSEGMISSFVDDFILKIFVHVFFYLRPQSTVKTNKCETLWNYLRTPNCLLIVFRSNTNRGDSPQRNFNNRAS